MHKRLDRWRQLHKCTKWSDSSNLSFDSITLLERLYFVQPWVFLHLLQTQAQTILVYGNNLCLNSFTGFNVLARIFNTLPRDFRNMNQALNAVYVYECTEVD